MMYEHLFEEDSIIKPTLQYDETYALRLLQLEEESKKNAYIDVSAVKKDLQQLKETMGDLCLDIVVLKYGVSEEEMYDNFRLLAETRKYIQKGDVLSFDITHSFRSLAFYGLLAINFLNMAAGNDRKLNLVSYGMFEYKSYHEEKTPIINQAPLIELLDWTKAAEEYQRFGTTYLLSGLLEDGSLQIDMGVQERLAIGRLGDMVSINNIGEIKNMVKNCQKIVAAGGSGNVAVDYIFEDIVKRFGKAVDDDANLVCTLAKWHIEKKRYVVAGIMTIEHFVRKCGDLSGLQDESIRNRLKRNYKKIKKSRYRERKDDKIEQFLHKYEAIRIYRNKLCHDGSLSATELPKLDKNIQEIFDIYEKLEKDAVAREYFREYLTEP